jgi:hypothetical protein
MSIDDDMAKIAANTNREIAKLRGVTMAGLVAGGYVILRQAQEWVPVEYGILKGSGYLRKTQDDDKGAAVTVGFSATYAVWVHEDMEQTLKGKPRRSGIGVYWGPSGRPRFLADAVEEKKSDVVQAIKDRAAR